MRSVGTQTAMKLVGLALAALCVALVAACGGGDDDQAVSAPATVTSGPRMSEIRDLKFESPMKVTAGSEVTWVNKDGMPHNVIAGDGSFKSETLDKDARFTHTFAKAGKFEFTCAFHPGMNGVVEVE